jgi:hypothetical protein
MEATVAMVLHHLLQVHQSLTLVEVVVVVILLLAQVEQVVAETEVLILLEEVELLIQVEVEAVFGKELLLVQAVQA